MMYENDTIAAIVTGLTQSGVGIIRVSGKDAISIVDKIFVNKFGKHKLKEKESHTISYGYIIDKKKEEEITDNNEQYWKSFILDECMISLFKAPKSYTMEDVVEVNCHGGILIMQSILELIVKMGARIAQPGEFTKRAFLNGRIDLSRAEAVMDIIQSQSKLAMDASVKQLNGSIYRKIKEIRKRVIYEIAFIESALDDPEHISLDGYEEKITKVVEELLTEIKKMIDSSKSGILRREGIQTTIVGRPNAGKSSIMNLLLNEERAIVTDIAGTTRDLLKEYIQIGEIGLHIIDTAGIRQTEDEVEKIGVNKAKDSILEADLVLHVIDGSAFLDETDKMIKEFSQEKPVIILLNKSDLDNVVSFEEIDRLYQDKKHYVISFSAKEKTGVHEMEEIIRNIFFQGEVKSNQEVVITNIRHKEALIEVEKSLKNVMISIENHMPEDFLSIDLMSAYEYLGKIIGEEIEDDLVEEIFTKFCMGK